MSAAPKILDYRHLESALLDAVSMADIACEMVDAAENNANRQGGGWTLSQHEMARITWSVFHVSKLIRLLEAKWDEVHKSNVASEKGGAQ